MKFRLLENVFANQEKKKMNLDIFMHASKQNSTSGSYHPPHAVFFENLSPPAERGEETIVVIWQH